uniref:Uncharacterized protein n=1 Tax=Eukaryota sp. BB2 TaxID=1949062 RepID=A0A1X8VEX0_9EUKA|nr:hypothetical protein CCM08_mgp15 [Eukaryota sp. BB2]AQL10446.1 hypothetical protein [Eukaryota sp. BB2]
MKFKLPKTLHDSYILSQRIIKAIFEHFKERALSAPKDAKKVANFTWDTLKSPFTYYIQKKKNEATFAALAKRAAEKKVIYPNSSSNLGNFLRNQIQAEINIYNRKFNPGKKAIVFPTRNILRERKYHESYQKYKPYFAKPHLPEDYSTYIDHFHDMMANPFFNIKKELQKIISQKKFSVYAHVHKEVEKFEWHNLNAVRTEGKRVGRFSTLSELVHEWTLDFTVWFPFYDFYGILSFLF